MLRTELHERFDGARHIVFAVIHVRDVEQAQRNAEVAIQGGAHGVLLINHDFSVEQFLPIVRIVRKVQP